MPHPDAEPPDALRTRGGISGGIGCDWWTTLVRAPGRSGPTDFDAIGDRPVAPGVAAGAPEASNRRAGS